MHATPIDIQAHAAEAALSVRWSDGASHHLPYYALRCACRCAGCVDERTGRRLLNPDSVPRNIRIESVGLRGRYAMQITWSDGHDTGLYTWDHLRELADAWGESPDS